MGLPRTVSEIDGDFSRKLLNFLTSVYIAPSLTGFPLESGTGAGVNEKSAQRDANTARPPQSPTDAQSPRWL